MMQSDSKRKNFITVYHAKYYAHILTRRDGQGIERLSQSLFDASVDLNPHQFNASAFSLANPESEGVILADEGGLGKTIEAGLMGRRQNRSSETETSQREIPNPCTVA